MNIFDHLIPDHAILGIGPLMREESKMGRRRYYFSLHLTSYTTIISSDWYESIEDKEVIAHLRAAYNSVREKIARLIGEETDAHKVRVAEVEILYNTALDNFQTILANLQPAGPETPATINARAQRMVDDLLDFKMLATK